MILGAARSNRSTALAVAAVIFIIFLVSLAYQHSDSIKLPGRPSSPPEVDDTSSVVEPEKKPESAVSDSSEKTDLRSFYFEHLHKPSIKPDEHRYKPWGALEWKLPEKVHFTKPLGENLCIIDLDNRPFNEPHQLFGPEPMSWKNAEHIHGLSLGVLNHWLYAKIHGYKYYYIEIDTPADRRASWKKPPIMSKILKDHDACLYLDSDAIFHNLDLPFEWLMNYWSLRPDVDSMALALDPNANNNKDKFGKVYLNTGFIVAQNNPKTYEVMDAWQNCPEENSKHPDCVIFRTNGPGRPTDQGGFGTYIRYDYSENVKELSCTEANGFPASHSGCEGIFIRHLWTGKHDWIKIDMGEQLPGPYLELFHKEYLEDKKNFYITEPDLMKMESPRKGH